MIDINEPVDEVGDKDNFPVDAITDDAMVEEAFTNAFDRKPESTFLTDVYEFWETKGYITVKQWNAVNAIAEEE